MPTSKVPQSPKMRYPKKYLTRLNLNRPYDSMKQHVSSRFFGLKVELVANCCLLVGWEWTNLSGCRFPGVYIYIYILKKPSIVTREITNTSDMRPASPALKMDRKWLYLLDRAWNIALLYLENTVQMVHGTTPLSIISLDMGTCFPCPWCPLM